MAQGGFGGRSALRAAHGHCAFGAHPAVTIVELFTHFTPVVNIKHILKMRLHTKQVTLMTN